MTRHGVTTFRMSPSIVKDLVCSVPSHFGFQATSTLVTHLFYCAIDLVPSQRNREVAQIVDRYFVSGVGPCEFLDYGVQVPELHAPDGHDIVPPLVGQ